MMEMSSMVVVVPPVSMAVVVVGTSIPFDAYCYHESHHFRRSSLMLLLRRLEMVQIPVSSQRRKGQRRPPLQWPSGRWARLSPHFSKEYRYSSYSS
jgi:hypothetical protein